MQFRAQPRRSPGDRGAAARPGRQAPAYTLMEVVISLLIISVSLGAILTVYVQSAVRSEWSAYSLAAQMMALDGIEQCRAAKFDPRGSPPTDALVSSNFPVRVDVLDVSTLNNVLTYGTNTITI